MNIRIANRLLEYRRANGYSQEELAEKLGVSRQAVSKWERAEASPDTDNLIALAALYGVTIDELINGNDSPTGSKADGEGADASEGRGREDGEDSDDSNDSNCRQDAGDHVNIGFGGIHIDDKEGNHVHIGRRGIHVDDTKGTHVHVGIDGIRVEESAGANANVNIKDGKLYVDDEYVCNVKIGDNVDVRGGHVYVNGRERRMANEAFNWLNASVPLLTVIAYLVMGFVFPWGWRIGWLVFFLIPIIPSFVSAVRRRKASRFSYPVLVAGVYLLLGMWRGMWHPWWILFLTIPLYYIICTTIEHSVRK